MIRYVDTASENTLHFSMHTYTRHKPLSRFEELIHQRLVSKAKSMSRKRKQQRQRFRKHRPLQRILDGVCGLPLMKWSTRNQCTRFYGFKPSKQYKQRMPRLGSWFSCNEESPSSIGVLLTSCGKACTNSIKSTAEKANIIHKNRYCHEVGSFGETRSRARKHSGV